MLKRSTLSRSWFLVVAAGLVIAGCSTMPTAPVVDTHDASSSSTRSMASSDPNGLLGDLTGSLLSAPTTVSSTKTIYGLLGGVVSAGNFKVIIPPLAIRGTAVVTVTQPDLSSPVVELKIGPESANRFLLPVLLVADVSRLSPALISVSYLSWLNPATGQWERVPGCSISILNLTIQAPLSHFSTYRVERDGKAGW
jgi:hypothetical protein